MAALTFHHGRLNVCGWNGSQPPAMRFTAFLPDVKTREVETLDFMTLDYRNSPFNTAGVSQIKSFSFPEPQPLTTSFHPVYSLSLGWI